MDENTALTIYIVIAIASLIGILITINLIIYYCCVRPRRRGTKLTKPKKNDYKKQNNENSNSKLLLNDDIIININETTSSNKLALDSDVYKYLGISLSEIPFIDEDSKANSCVDLNWNPYKALPD